MLFIQNMNRPQSPRLLPILALLGLILGLSSCEAWRLDPQTDPVQAVLDKAVEGNYEGMIVCVNKPGETALYAAGWDNRESRTPADPQALFKIASISKLYMAAAAAKLVAAGSLSLDSSLESLIPEVAGEIEYADEISLRMMIQHRSGIPEYIFHPDFPDQDPEADYLTTAALIFGEPADFRPGRKYQYSNTNYLLLGEIMDRALGYSHHTYIREEILQPLGLTRTFSLYSEVDSNEVMSGYYAGYEPDLKAATHTRPGGSMIATAEEVSIFLRALIDGSLLTTEEQAIYAEVYEYEHTGWLPGYTSIARYHEDMDAVVVQFVNTSKKQNFWIGLERVYRKVVRAAAKTP